MFSPEDRNMLVRGRATIQSRDDEMIVYTHWYRHDDDLDILKYEFENLARCYMDMEKTQGIGMDYEYKEYIK